LIPEGIDVAEAIAPLLADISSIAPHAEMIETCFKEKLPNPMPENVPVYYAQRGLTYQKLQGVISMTPADFVCDSNGNRSWSFFCLSYSPKRVKTLGRAPSVGYVGALIVGVTRYDVGKMRFWLIFPCYQYDRLNPDDWSDAARRRSSKQMKLLTTTIVDMKNRNTKTAPEIEKVNSPLHGFSVGIGFVVANKVWFGYTI
jgi:hypothetical protein